MNEFGELGVSFYGKVEVFVDRNVCPIKVKVSAELVPSLGSVQNSIRNDS